MKEKNNDLKISVDLNRTEHNLIRIEYEELFFCAIKLTDIIFFLLSNHLVLEERIVR
jgi:hypothetical protein